MDPLRELEAVVDAEELAYYSAQEVADILRISKAQVYRLCKAGKIGHTRLGEGPSAMIRVPRADLEAYAMRRYRAAWHHE